MFPRLPRRTALGILLLALAGCDDPLGGGDPLPPRLTVYSPAAGWVEESDSLLVQAMAEDDRAVERVSFRLNGGAEQAVKIERAKAVFFNFTVRELRLGANELEILAYDASGRAGSQRVAFSTRDVSPPVVTVQSPAPRDVVERDSVRVTGVARDAMRVAALTYSLDGGAEQSVPLAPGKEAPFAFTLRGTAPGEHALVLRARDEAGNVGVDTLRFSTASATITLRSPAQDTSASHFVVVFRGEIESASPIQRFGVVVGGGEEHQSGGLLVYNLTRISDPGQIPIRYTFSVPVAGLGQGRQTAVLYAYDTEGKRVARVERTLTVSVPARRYGVAYLGTLGGSDSHGIELNEKGQVVGWSLTASGAKHAFFWEAGQMRDLGAGLGTESRATGINESGQVVGWLRSDCYRSFTWRAGQTAAPLQEPAGCEYRAVRVNDAGKVLLQRNEFDGTGGALWDAGVIRPFQRGTRHILGVTHLNNRDQAIGLLYDGWSNNIPVFVSPDAPPVLVASLPATDLNDLGHATILCAGKTSVVGPSCEPYVAGLPGSVIASPAYPKGSMAPAHPFAINNRDQVAGTYLWLYGAEVSRSRAFLWEAGTTYDVELAESDWEIDAVSDVNDAGVILAHGRNVKTGRRGAVLLTPRS